MTSKTFGPETARRPHLVTPGKGGVAGEVADLRMDVETAIEKLELRTGQPELDWLDITGGALLAAGGDIVLEGRNLLQGQTFATLTLGTGTSEIVITAHKPGLAGNDFTVEVTASGGGETAVLTGSALVLDVDDGTSTADAIVTLINAAAATCDGYLRAVSGGVGTVHPVAAAANLAGGNGDGLTVLVSGVEALPANNGTTSSVTSVDDGTITCTVPALTGETPARAAADIVGIIIESDGLRTQQLSGVLA